MYYILKFSSDPEMIEIWYIYKQNKFLAAIIHVDLVDDDIKDEIDKRGEVEMSFSLDLKEA